MQRILAVPLLVHSRYIFDGLWVGCDFSKALSAIRKIFQQEFSVWVTHPNPVKLFSFNAFVIYNAQHHSTGLLRDYNQD